MRNAQRNDVLNGYAQKLIAIKARQICRKAGFNRSDEEDLKQEMFLHLLGQADHFDSGRASLDTFIDRVVNSCVAMILRDRRRLKRAGRVTTQSLESTLMMVEGERIPACEAILPEDLHRRTGVDSRREAALQEEAAAVAEAVGTMPTNLQEMCRRLMAGTVTSVARDLGESRRQVRHKIREIRGFFEQAGFEAN